MMLDSSAVVAIVLREPGWERLVELLRASSLSAIGSPTLVECGVLLRARLRADPEPLLDRFLRAFSVQEVPCSEQHRREALDAYRRFGRGRHPAQLDFGDCLAYATARLAGLPLLFVGEDFARADVGSLSQAPGQLFAKG